MAITFEPLHPTFVAECKGVDFSKVNLLLTTSHIYVVLTLTSRQVPLSDEDLQTVKDGIAKYGVLIFRNTGLDNVRTTTLYRIGGKSLTK